VQTHQIIQVQITGDFLLNLIAVSPTGQGWNRAVSGETWFETRFPRPDLAGGLSDNNAVWIAARLAVFDHPWFAVTGLDESCSLPPGEHTIKTVHRYCVPRSRVVRVSPIGASTTFHFSAPGEAAGK